MHDNVVIHATMADMNVEYKTEGSHDSYKLINYLRILLKRKFLLLGIMCAVIVIVGAMSLNSPKIFTLETILQIGQVEGQNVESPFQVVEKITGGIYNVLIASQLKISAAELPEIKAKYIDNTQLIVINADVQDKERGKEILNALSTRVMGDHQEKIADKRDFLEKEIAQLSRKQQMAENTFQSGLSSSRVSETAQFLVMNSIQSRIDSLQGQINIDRKALYSTSDTQVIKLPTDSSTPASHRSLTIIILAGISGLFLGIFVVLVREWWESSQAL